MYDVDDTIAAIASAQGGALRGIVRISGPEMVPCLERCFQPAEEIVLALLTRPTVVPGNVQLGQPLGDVSCAAYVWPGQRSYTRQPTAELHTIGARPVLDAVLDSACRAGARLAGPGEFTMRAFLAGRLDLTQAEAVLGVIDATTQQELDAALQQLGGGLAAPLNALRDKLLDLLAHLEAGLDFVEEDINFIESPAVITQLEQAVSSIAAIREQLATRSDAAHESKVVLCGWPNVGKSSLLNALAGEAVAIVHETAGTTSDYVERRITLGDVRAILIDTAGVEDGLDDGGPQAAAQGVAARQRERATLQLFCLDASRPIHPAEQAALDRPNPARLVVLTKCDSRTMPPVIAGAIETSSVTGEGLERLRAAICERLTETTATGVAGTAVRCHDSLRQAQSALDRAGKITRQALGDELVAAEIRVALEELGKVVGVVYTDDILDRIFSRFCIGK